ncbi:hypothetical protein [Litorihabitans aurantiacus]|uniref:Histidine kinase DraK N-terminal domain-containing protein n=1 Tax=Litorihabitans aurantiacus TaxID=1930061 RepID=A0AA37XD16_9MICO|nr:hypothetical protein GCM10025875_05920 [Litorihabitans aurantiacus]
MQRRLLQATIAAVLVAVVLIGAPVAILSAITVRNSIEENLTVRAQAIARAVERRASINEPITTDQLLPWVEEGDALTLSIEVTPARGSVVEVGPEMPARSVVRVVPTASGADVRVAISGDAMALRMAQVVIFVALAAIVATAAAVVVARYQARRLAAPSSTSPRARSSSGPARSGRAPRSRASRRSTSSPPSWAAPRTGSPRVWRPSASSAPTPPTSCARR